MRARLPMDQYLGKVRLRRSDVASFDAYPVSLPVVLGLERLEMHRRATYFVGDNGTAKSTLLEAVAIAFGLNPEGASRSFLFGTRASDSNLHEYLALVKGARRPRDAFFLRAESPYNLATDLDRMQRECGGELLSYGSRSLHEQSHGESFWAVVPSRFGGRGLYMLDEPEAALAPSRQIAFLTRMHELIRMDSQFVIATRSPILMAYPDSWIYRLAPNGLHRVAYEDTEHFRASRRSFEDHLPRFVRRCRQCRPIAAVAREGDRLHESSRSWNFRSRSARQTFQKRGRSGH